MLTMMSQKKFRQWVARYDRDNPPKGPTAGQKVELRRRRKVEQILKRSEAEPSQTLTANRTESMFAELAKSKSGRLFRHGWPDFLVELPGSTIGVEVKQGPDQVSLAQAKMFTALERVGLKIYIWNPKQPAALTPWKTYLTRRPRRTP